MQALLDRAARLARQANVTCARQLRRDRTCGQTPIHHPTDSGLLGDGVRVLTRRLRRARPLGQEQLAGGHQALRSRLRATRRLLQQLQRGRRLQGDKAAEPPREPPRELYARRLDVTRRTGRQADRVRQALATTWGDEPPPASRPASPQDRAAQRLLAQLDRFLPRVRPGIQQAQQRVLDGQPVASAPKGLSLFEPPTRVVKRGKIAAAVEFGRQVVVDEVAGGGVPRCHVLADDESEGRQALPAVEQHPAVFGRPPWLVTGDRRRHTQGLEELAELAHDRGVTHVVIPRIGRLSATQRARERQRAWKRRYRWRAGIEGRIQSVRRDDGLARCRSQGEVGLERDGGWGGLASNLRHSAQKTGDRPKPAMIHSQPGDLDLP